MCVHQWLLHLLCNQVILTNIFSFSRLLDLRIYVNAWVLSKFIYLGFSLLYSQQNLQLFGWWERWWRCTCLCVCILEGTKICVYVPLTYLVQHVNMYTSFSCSIRRENYFYYYYYNHYYNNGDEDEDHKKTKPTVH